MSKLRPYHNLVGERWSSACQARPATDRFRYVLTQVALRVGAGNCQSVPRKVPPLTRRATTIDVTFLVCRCTRACRFDRLRTPTLGLFLTVTLAFVGVANVATA